MEKSGASQGQSASKLSAKRTAELGGFSTFEKLAMSAGQE